MVVFMLLFMMFIIMLHFLLVMNVMIFRVFLYSLHLLIVCLISLHFFRPIGAPAGNQT